MKKFIVSTIVLISALTFTACNSSTDQTSATTLPTTSAEATTPTTTSEQTQTETQGEDSEDIPVRIENYSQDEEEGLQIYVDIPNNGGFTLEVYVGDSHIYSVPSSEDVSVPYSALYDSSETLIVENNLGRVHPWGVAIQVATEGYDFDLDNVSTVKIEGISDLGSSLSGEYPIEQVLADGASWYEELGHAYAGSNEIVDSDENSVVTQDTLVERAPLSLDASELEDTTDPLGYIIDELNNTYQAEWGRADFSYMNNDPSSTYFDLYFGGFDISEAESNSKPYMEKVMAFVDEINAAFIAVEEYQYLPINIRIDILMDGSKIGDVTYGTADASYQLYQDDTFFDYKDGAWVINPNSDSMERVNE